MKDITVVTERGQTSIPARLRKEHQVEPGTELLWEAFAEDEWRVHIRRKSLAKANPLAMVGFAKRFRKARRTADWLKEIRGGKE